MAAKDPIPKQFFKVLKCPRDEAKLKYNKDKTGIECTKCSKEFEIKNGVPILT